MVTVLAVMRVPLVLALDMVCVSGSSGRFGRRCLILVGVIHGLLCVIFGVLLQSSE